MQADPAVARRTPVHHTVLRPRRELGTGRRRGEQADTASHLVEFLVHVPGEYASDLRMAVDHREERIAVL